MARAARRSAQIRLERGAGWGCRRWMAVIVITRNLLLVLWRFQHVVPRRGKTSARRPAWRPGQATSPGWIGRSGRPGSAPRPWPGSRPQPAGGPTGSRSRMGPGPGRSAGAGGMSSLAGAAAADAPDRRDPAGGDISQLADVCAPMSPHPRSTPTTGSSPGADGGDEPAASAAAARPLPGAGQTVPSCTGAPSLPRAAVGDLADRAEGTQARGAGAGHSTSPMRVHVICHLLGHSPRAGAAIKEFWPCFGSGSGRDGTNRPRDWTSLESAHAGGIFYSRPLARRCHPERRVADRG